MTKDNMGRSGQIKRARSNEMAEDFGLRLAKGLSQQCARDSTNYLFLRINFQYPPDESVAETTAAFAAMQQIFRMLHDAKPRPIAQNLGISPIC